jgi:hypothetical protein
VSLKAEALVAAIRPLDKALSCWLSAVSTFVDRDRYHFGSVGDPPAGSGNASFEEAPADKDDDDVHRHRQHCPQILVAVRQTM